VNAKHACFNLNTAPAREREKIIIQLSGVIGRCRIDEGWPALAGVGMQSKLRNYEQFPANSAKCQVHFAGLIGENSQAGDPVVNKIGIAGRITFGDAQQNDETPSDPADCHSVNPNFRSAYTLNDCTHEIES